MATLRCIKSRRNGDLYEPGSPAGTTGNVRIISYRLGFIPLTFFIPVRFNIPMGVDISGLVLFAASNFYLLEAPLGEVNIASPKITAENGVSQSKGGG